ncbi:MAG TPA: hypothetical protein VHF07_09350 [Nitrospiraceae bacterium]|nr:hypothetical protein [Nitrospiraceae bacterium]
MNRPRYLLILLSSSILSGACNSDVPESAVMESPRFGLRVAVTRVATHPFLARYNLKVRIERRDGCVAVSDLFPDTGRAGRRNLYRSGSGTVLVVGQFDARVLREDRCMIELVEFRHLEQGGTFLGTFDLDEQKRWRFLPPDVRPEQPFEKS